MKIKNRPDDIKNWPDDAGVLEAGDWITQLRDDRRADLAGNDGPKPEATPAAPPAKTVTAPDAIGGQAETTGWDASGGHIEATGWDAFGERAETSDPGASGRAEITEQAPIRGRAEITERAAIGDQLRMPIAWCEMGACVAHHTDPAALGEADIRARAISTGWRVDALGRLACPQCQQSDPGFWASHPVALWDRDAAVSMVTLMAVARRSNVAVWRPGTGE